MSFKLSADIAGLRAAFDNPQSPMIVLSAAECQQIASDLVELELEADQQAQAELEACMREGKLIVENKDLRFEIDRLVRENQMLRRQLAGESAEIVPFRPRHQSGHAPTGPGGNAA